MDRIYSVAYDMISSIPFEGHAVVYNDLSIEYTTNNDDCIYDHNDDDVKPILKLNLSESYWFDHFISGGVDLRDDVYNDNYEWLILDLAESYSELISEVINNYTRKE